MAKENHQKNSEDLLDKNGDDIRIYESDRSDETSENHDRLSNYFSKQNDEPEDTQTRSNIQMNHSRGEAKSGESSSSPQNQERFSSEEAKSVGRTPQNKQSSEEQSNQETTSNRVTKQSVEERQQEEPLSSGRASEEIDLTSPQNDNTGIQNNPEQQPETLQARSTPQSKASNPQSNDEREAVVKEVTEEAEEKTAAEEAAAKEAEEKAVAEETAAKEAEEKAAAEEAAAKEAEEKAAAEEAAAKEAAEAEAGFGLTDVEDAAFSGSWGQIDEGLDGWYSDNDGGKIEVGKETTYGGSDSSNVIIELEADSGDQSNLYKDFDTSPGQVIEISFDHSARGGRGGEDSAVEVYWDGELIDTIVPGDSFGWENHSYEVTADGDSARLEFQATDSNSLGTLLDNIKVDIIDELNAIDGSSGNNTLNGSEEADYITGNAGHDTINGNGGDDVIVGGTGNDNLRGGGGDDRFEISQGDGFDDFDGGEGTDTIVATEDNVTIGINTHFNPADSVEEISADGNSGVTIAGDGSNNNMDFSETTLTDIEHIDGGSGHDTITGSAGDDVIIGGTGNDNLRGGDGDDHLVFLANQGTDTVDGGEGWSDSIQLQGFSGLDQQDGWTLNLDEGHVIESSDIDAGVMLLSEDSAGSIEFEDGGSITFENVEQITW